MPIVLRDNKILLVKGKIATSLDCCCRQSTCPETCGGCPYEYDITINFPAPWDWISISNHAIDIYSIGGCVWLAGVLEVSTFPKVAVLENVALSCRNGLWYIDMSICATQDVMTGHYAICGYESKGRATVAPGCPPLGEYTFSNGTSSSSVPCPGGPTVSISKPSWE